MKKAWVLATAFVFCAAVALAGGEVCRVGVAGATITKVDTAARSMVVRSAEGKDMTIYWNDATKIEGKLKEGETVRFQPTFKDGKIWATSLQVGTLKK